MLLVLEDIMFHSSLQNTKTKDFKNAVLIKNKRFIQTFKKDIKMCLGFSPKNIDIYLKAFTHKSVLNPTEIYQSNERLEFLGDSVLSLIIAEHLYHVYPFKDEGFYSRIRSQIVSRDNLNQIGMLLKFNDYLSVVTKEVANGASFNISDSMVGNSFEAFIGAIYLDKGYKYVDKFFNKLIKLGIISFIKNAENNTNYKSLILEWGQKHNFKIEYKQVREFEENRDKMFEIELLVDKISYGKAVNKKKKKAEQEVSYKALRKLNLIED